MKTISVAISVNMNPMPFTISIAQLETGSIWRAEGSQAGWNGRGKPVIASKAMAFALDFGQAQFCID
jgi:hypothetical protein